MAHHRNVQRTALQVTRWVGSPASIVTHTIVFVLSFLAVWLHVLSFDRMLLILTTIVSLEAIYLAIFIQMTINFTTQELEEVGQDIEEMQEDLGEIQEDVGELQEDVEDIGEEEEAGEVAEQSRNAEQKKTLDVIQGDLRKLMNDIEGLRQPKP